MRDYFSLVTFSHTIFALPFAILGFVLAVLQPQYSFSYYDLALVVGCMVFARSAAMAFNRLVDRDIDASNERTATRDIPAGNISVNQARVFITINALLFMLCAALLNTLCLLLSPIALLVILGYSYTKRFTWLCHIILGLGLALAPIGGYLAITGQFAALPVYYSLLVLFWVAGFDIIYALQDQDFDQSKGLNSIPSHFGTKRSLLLSKLFHLICIAFLSLASYQIILLFPEAIYYVIASGLVFIFALIYQHTLVSADDFSKINRAFFTTNGIASIVYAVVLITGLVLNS